MKTIVNLLAGITLLASSVAPVVGYNKKSDFNIGLVNQKLNSNSLNWQHCSLPSLKQGDINYSPVKINNVWFLSTRSGLYTSTDGINWTKENTPFNNVASPILHYLNNDQKGYTYFAATFSQGLWTSSDGFSWTQAHGLPPTTDIQFPPVKLGNTYYLGTLGHGLWTSSDGINWNQNNIPHALKTANIYYLPKKLKNDTFYVGQETEGCDIVPLVLVERK